MNKMDNRNQLTTELLTDSLTGVLKETDSTVYQIDASLPPLFWNPVNTLRNGMLCIVGKASSSKSAFLNSKKAINRILNK